MALSYGETEDKVEEQMRHLSCKATVAGNKAAWTDRFWKPSMAAAEKPSEEFKNKSAGTAMIVRNVAMPQANYQLKYISTSPDRLDEPLEEYPKDGANRRLPTSPGNLQMQQLEIENVVLKAKTKSQLRRKARRQEHQRQRQSLDDGFIVVTSELASPESQTTAIKSSTQEHAAVNVIDVKEADAKADVNSVVKAE